MSAAQSRFPRGHREEPLGQIGIERGGQSDWLREACGINGRVAVQTLFMKNHGDPQPRVLDEESLNRVGEFRRAAGVPAGSRVAGAADLADPAPILEGRLGFRKIEVAVGVDESFGLPLPDAHHLGGLFFQRHPGQKVLDAFGRGQIGIVVRVLFRLDGRWFHIAMNSLCTLVNPNRSVLVSFTTKHEA